MTTVGIVGAGKAAFLHAQAASMTEQVELVGVGGGSNTAADLAGVCNAPDLPLDSLIERSDAVIVAVPPNAVAEVVSALDGRVNAVLVEAPVHHDVPDPDCPAMVGANLLHAPVVRRAIQEIWALSSPHHLELRSTQPRPEWGAHATHAFGGAGLDPGARLAPVLLAAAGEPAETVTARLVDGPDDGIEESADLTLTLGSGRSVRLSSVWREGSAKVELEVADDNGVVLVSFFPEPTLEINGTPVNTDPLHPIVGLGFVAQLERLTRVSLGESAPWLDLSAGRDIGVLISAAVADARGDPG